MSLLEIQPWTLGEFFAWQELQDERYELVNGFPAKMMTGASNRHDVVTANIQGQLWEKLKGKTCRHFTGDGAVETFPGQIRRPDAGIDCGAFDPDGYLAAEPVVVFEVLSPSTRDFDRLRKVEEYKRVAAMRHIVVVEPTRPQVLVWSRDETGRSDGEWTAEEMIGIDRVIRLHAVALELPLAEIYDRLDFKA
ncbi:Uma2 family endonuclease [Jiella mangrovi]|uniref:Uma2 family endonuclease n=1 Tax=Jiella mangrovi TaxID=2821407 RepID=A0ABS4BJV4_9HYPH|nr:Uma2 family endonuclease [Jiella mangrovi]MBP0616446.1 Uma2 family endonuclease [Jiella mangrovi]